MKQILQVALLFFFALFAGSRAQDNDDFEVNVERIYGGPKRTKYNIETMDCKRVEERMSHLKKILEKPNLKEQKVNRVNRKLKKLQEGWEKKNCGDAAQKRAEL